MNMSIKKLLKQIDVEKTIIAKHRDNLRTIYNDLDHVLESLDRGIEGLESGKREIEDAVDAFSETL